MDSKDKDRIEQWLKSNVSSKDIKSEIDFIEMALEVLRIKHRYLENHLSFENFIQGKVYFEEDRLKYFPANKVWNLGSGTKPIHLQPKLLIYLLLNYKKKGDVYNIIDDFIDTIWNELKTVDFKRTKTGVRRCFTNTRFAANVLRAYGLLKFSQKEAYKTWNLSLFGFLVASKLLQQNLYWNFSVIDQIKNQKLHPEILSAAEHFKTYPDFVGGLENICLPNKKNEIFQKFDSVLRETYVLLAKYLAVINDLELSQKDREKLSKEKIQQLERHKDIDKFYVEFSTYIYVENYLKKLMAQEN